MSRKPLTEHVSMYLDCQRMLIERPATTGDVSKEMGCNYATAGRWVKAFLAAGAIEFVGFAKRKSPRGTFPSLYRWKA